MTVHAGKGLTRNAPDVLVPIDDASPPLMLAGGIFRQNPQGRESPQACSSGFEAPGAAVARGHLLAREHGGCDDPRQAGAGPEETRSDRGTAEGAAAQALGREPGRARGAASAHRRRGADVRRDRTEAEARA